MTEMMGNVREDNLSNDMAPSVNQAAPSSGFFYGTLMAPEVFYTVCYRTKDVPVHISTKYTFQPAILHGYCRRRVKYAEYPGIVEDPAHVVRGTLVTGLTPENLSVLDFFEGSDYVRRKVSIRLLDRVGDDKGAGNVEGEERVADVYVFLDPAELEEAEWDFEEFRREKMQKWTRAGWVFEDCDPEQPATVADGDIPEEAKESAV